MQKNYQEKIIDQIQEIRRKNNIYWMNLLRLAFECDSKKAKKIFRQITENDKQINELSKKLSE